MKKWSKLTCIFGKIFGKFSDFQNKLIFGTNTDTEKYTKIFDFRLSTFDFRLSTFPV